MSDAPNEPLMPANLDAEAGVLGSILIDPEAITKVADYLRPEDFYRDAHRTIYAAIRALYEDHQPADLITLPDELARQGHLEDVGGASYVSSLANRVPTSANVDHYGQIVERCAIQRRLIEAAGRIAKDAYAQPADVDALLERSARLIERARGEGKQRAAPFHLLSIAEVLDQPRPDPLIERFYTRNSTGMLYSPSGIGKTVLLLDQMAHVALGQPWEGHPVTAGHVVYVCAEGQVFLPERLRALMRKLNVDDIPRLHVLPVRVQLLASHTVPGLIATFTTELSEQPVWVAFDTLSQTAGGVDENDAAAMGAYLTAMDRIRETTGAFVCAIHHTGKDESRGARGSSVLRANCDTVIQIAETDGKDKTVVARCEKQRGGWVPFKPFGFRVKSLALDDHADYTGPVMEACDVPDAPAAQPRKPSPQVQAVFDVFMDLYRQYTAAPTQLGVGVSYGKWKAACQERNIGEGTFKEAYKRLRDDFHLVYQETAKSGERAPLWHPTTVPADGGTEGRVRDDHPDSSHRPNGTDEGMDGTVPLERVIPPSLPDALLTAEARVAMNGHQHGPHGHLHVVPPDVVEEDVWSDE